MPKDLKIGMAVGLSIIIIAVIYLATRPGLSTEARIPQPDANQLADRGLDQLRFSTELPSTSHGASETSSAIANTTAPQHPTTPPQPQSDPVVAVNDYRTNQLTEPIQTTRFHIVRKGDTLSSIAKDIYGTTTAMQKIKNANPDKIKDVNRIYPGMKLIIPE